MLYRRRMFIMLKCVLGAIMVYLVTELDFSFGCIFFFLK